MSFTKVEIAILLPVSENKRPPYWNSTSDFDFHLCVIIAMTLCVSLPYFLQIRQLAAKSWRHSDFQDGGHGIAILLRFSFCDFAQSGRLKSTWRPNFGEISQSTAGILLLAVSENRRPQCWKSTSGFDFHHYVIMCMTFCMCLYQISSKSDPATELWRHIHFAWWRPRHRNSTSGFVCLWLRPIRKVEVNCRPNFGEIFQSTAEILLFPVSEKQTSAMLEFYFRFRFHVCIIIGMTFCIGISNLIPIGPSAAKLWRHIDFQDGGRQPCWMSSRVTADHPRSANGVLSLVLKSWSDFYFRRYRYFILWRIGLKLLVLYPPRMPRMWG